MLASATSVFAENSGNLVNMKDWVKSDEKTEITDFSIQFSYGDENNFAPEIATLLVDISKEVLEYDSIFVSTDYKIVWAGESDGVAFAEIEFYGEDEGNLLYNKIMLDWTGSNFEMEAPENISAKIKIPENTHSLRMILKGRDQKEWEGNYGPIFSNIEIVAFSKKENSAVKTISKEDEKVIKNFENGRIVIFRGDKKFDVFGREIK